MDTGIAVIVTVLFIAAWAAWRIARFYVARAARDAQLARDARTAADAIRRRTPPD